MKKSETERPAGDSCCPGSSACGTPSVGRRSFIKATGLTATMLAAGRMGVMAGPFSKEDFEKIVPSDKKLSKEWIAGLYARGNPLSATGDDLKYIGMPINGICTGQVYLGGDGKLWHWNLDASLDQKNKGSGPRFLNPDVAHSPMSQGFALQAGGKEFALDSQGFKDITFTNQYPMATVDYVDSACPVKVQLNAYTPFIPLNRDDSSYPVIVMRYTIQNSSGSEQDVAIAGWVENISNMKSGKKAAGTKRCVYRELDEISTVECSAQFGGTGDDPDKEVFADFEGGTYGDWTVEGTAFGAKPSTGAVGIQKLSGMRGKGLANTWTGSDELQGKLTSPAFQVEKPFINFLIGGGADAKKLAASLWIDGKKVRSATGKKTDAMEWVSWDVKGLKGKQARFEILDASSSGWGHINVDQIEFSSHPAAQGAAEKLDKAADFGSIALGLLGSEQPEMVDVARRQQDAAGVFAATSNDVQNGAVDQVDFNARAFASLGRKISLEPGESKTISFALAWRFPNVLLGTGWGRSKASMESNHYATQWPTATAAAATVARRESELRQRTETWVETWYDSTLPYWFLERTFVTVDCVQTQTAQRIAETADTPEYYNLDEGVKCCPGNCTHVWHYAQGLARIFPEIERENRDKVEYAMGLDPKSGLINFRYYFGGRDAIDGTCGTILRVLRESQMTTDYSFLSSIWERVKLSMDFVIKKWDADEDGLLAGAQHNTLDQPWHGQVHWLINLYHAALKASAIMARQMKQAAVAERYESIVAKGAPAMLKLLWNEDFGYFIHKPVASGKHQRGSINGCHIDQVLGDSWVWNVGMDRILPKDKIRQALESLWTYNFTPNVGDFRKVMKEGRWYAAEGNAGLIMCSFPNGSGTESAEDLKGHAADFAAYFNECMTGFEWQVAAHMIWEGMVEKGLAIGKAIYDRYLPEDRNPYNEIECSDHYSRAMASYGAFTAMCGYHYDGPEGKLAFGPRMQQENFRAAFTAAEGWGSFAQKVVSGKQSASIELRYGQLTLNEFAVDQVEGTVASSAVVEVEGKEIPAEFLNQAGRYVVRFPKGLGLKAGQAMTVGYV